MGQRREQFNRGSRSYCAVDAILGEECLEGLMTQVPLPELIRKAPLHPRQHRAVWKRLPFLP